MALFTLFIMLVLNGQVIACQGPDNLPLDECQSLLSVVSSQSRSQHILFAECRLQAREALRDRHIRDGQRP